MLVFSIFLKNIIKHVFITNVLLVYLLEIKSILVLSIFLKSVTKHKFGTNVLLHFLEIC